ncbi:hypothetical protein Hdeb2414_s0014g00431641 [Helianthus debilis subsp. tardiflorus]
MVKGLENSIGIQVSYDRHLPVFRTWAKTHLTTQHSPQTQPNHKLIIAIVVRLTISLPSTAYSPYSPSNC